MAAFISASLWGSLPSRERGFYRSFRQANAPPIRASAARNNHQNRCDFSEACTAWGIAAAVGWADGLLGAGCGGPFMRGGNDAAEGGALEAADIARLASFFCCSCCTISRASARRG